MSVTVEAPMPGKILEIKVKAGDTVKEDDELAVLEAMKMENLIYAPAGGTVKEIKVEAGQNVVTGQVCLPSNSSVLYEGTGQNTFLLIGSLLQGLTT